MSCYQYCWIWWISKVGKSVKMPFSTFLPGPSIQNRLYPTAGGRAEFSIVRKIFLQSLLLPPSTVILGKMAQHARLLALLMAKLKGKSKSVTNMAWGNALDYNISKDQCSRIRTVASGLKKVHFWNPICQASLAWWDGPSPLTLSYLNRSG